MQTREVDQELREQRPDPSEKVSTLKKLWGGRVVHRGGSGMGDSFVTRHKGTRKKNVPTKEQV